MSSSLAISSSDSSTGIHQVKADLATQLVSIEGTAAPSAIVAAIEATGRDAILRGSGKSDSTYGWDYTSSTVAQESCHSS
jgi:hypothetical protein